MNTINNSYKNKRIEFHILQSFPVTCLNRDDVGAPKTAVVGGVTRARVSSQCWKRAVRLAMHDISGVELGVRTKLLSDLIAKECVSIGATDVQAKSCGDKIEKIFIKDSDTKKSEGDEAQDTKSDTLLFLANTEVKLIASKFKENGFVPEKVITQTDAKKQAKELSDIIGKSKYAQTENLDGLDIALFGRMVAQAPSMDVEAASSFSHAISTHKVTNEVEFFTAVADFSKDQGSAHMGSLEFNAATYYRYVSLDLGQLYDSLGGDEFFPQAITAFIKALYTAVPSARQTSQSGACLWDYAEVFVRKGQGLQLSFETPVKAKEGGYLVPSEEYMKSELAKKEKLSGSLFGKIAEFEFGKDENFSIDNLIDSVVKAAKA
ncbi:MAG: type I-E CRISPR-associated protein Cas7/Cse4/CasC [Treponema sp.]